MRILKVILAVAVVSSLLAFTGCGSTNSGSGTTQGNSQGQSSQGAPEKTNITIGLSLPACTYLPIYLAEQQGYFKDAGLNVKVVTFNGGPGLVQAMAAGSVDIGVGALPDVTNAIKSGASLRVFYMGLNYPAFGWFSKDTTSFKDAKGKRFSVSQYGSSTDFLTRYALIKAGLNPKEDVQIMQTGNTANTLAALDAGQVDVAILAPPYTYVAQQKGYKEILKLADLVPDYPYHTFYALQSFIKNNPNTIKTLLKAYVKGVDTAKSDKSLSVQTLETALKYSPQESSASYDEIINYLYADGRLPTKGLDAFWQMGIQNGLFKEAMPQNTWLDPTYINSYDQWK